MIDNFVLLIVSQWENYMQDEAPPHVALPAFVWLETHFPDCWLGIEDQQWPPQSPKLTPYDFFCGVGPKRKSGDQNQEHKVNRKNNFEVLRH
jgi:hypothetical protein